MKTREPAFPMGDMKNLEPYYGLTKRELIAAMAMQGCLASPVMRQLVQDYGTAEEAEQALAQSCVGFADALLAELEKK